LPVLGTIIVVNKKILIFDFSQEEEMSPGVISVDEELIPFLDVFEPT